MSDFIPRHQQPVTLAQLNQLEPELLTQEISRLRNSISHLQRSNKELDEFLNPPEGAQDDELDDETREELRKSIEENDETIASQEERMEMIRIALQNQLGVDAANSHYDVAASTPVGQSVPPTRGSLFSNESGPTGAALTNGVVSGEDETMLGVDDSNGVYL
ncbi:hypothetical protein MNV49_006777 [Pseudohyphozyma bogoriensis]|nr:hypothetical protein MNV49_006777 [Pseudohyphozyma bogoriensis]